MRELREGPGLDSLRREARHRGERGFAGVLRRARDLEHDRGASVAGAHHVGERAADVHSNSILAS